MPSDKGYSIMAIATQHWFLHCSTWLLPKMCLFAFCNSSSACIMALPKLTYVFLCTTFLSPRWRFAVHALLLLYETSKGNCRVSRGVSYVALCLKHCPKTRSETEHSDTPWSCDTPTFKSIKARALKIGHSVFCEMAGLIVVILFMLFSIYNTV